MVARDYSPATGTFTSLDSVQGGAANPLTMNRYLYALANPATLVDPDGHFPSSEAYASQAGGGFVWPVLPGIAELLSGATQIAQAATGVATALAALELGMTYVGQRGPVMRPPDIRDRREALKPQIRPRYGDQPVNLRDDDTIFDIENQFKDSVSEPEPGGGKWPNIRPPKWCGNTCRTFFKAATAVGTAYVGLSAVQQLLFPETSKQSPTTEAPKPTYSPKPRTTPVPVPRYTPIKMLKLMLE
jgi:hypothetical protein